MGAYFLGFGTRWRLHGLVRCWRRRGLGGQLGFAYVVLGVCVVRNRYDLNERLGGWMIFVWIWSTQRRCHRRRRCRRRIIWQQRKLEMY